MKKHGRNGDGPEPVGDPGTEARGGLGEALATLTADQTLSDNDQTSADADQTLSDRDQAAAEHDRIGAESDQHASDLDQAAADLDGAGRGKISRRQREQGSLERQQNQLRRAATARDRHASAVDRDRVAALRDAAAQARDALASELARTALVPGGDLIERLERLSATAAMDRVRAAADRKLAARDRAEAAREREALEAELRIAHLDGLTGVYRREMGFLALAHEIDRARRSDGQFVLAFVDVDNLKVVNDRDGHPAGDRVLQVVARALRARLRSFDPIMRYGGDEFVCGLGGTDVAEAERRFVAIRSAIETDAGVGITVGLAALAAGDTVEQLIERADAAMLEFKRQHNSKAIAEARIEDGHD